MCQDGNNGDKGSAEQKEGRIGNFAVIQLCQSCKKRKMYLAKVIWRVQAKWLKYDSTTDTNQGRQRGSTLGFLKSEESGDKRKSW